MDLPPVSQETDTGVAPCGAGFVNEMLKDVEPAKHGQVNTNTNRPKTRVRPQ